MGLQRLVVNVGIGRRTVMRQRVQRIIFLTAEAMVEAGGRSESGWDTEEAAGGVTVIEGGAP